jgi:hypothetical protein
MVVRHLVEWLGQSEGLRIQSCVVIDYRNQSHFELAQDLESIFGQRCQVAHGAVDAAVHDTAAFVIGLLSLSICCFEDVEIQSQELMHTCSEMEISHREQSRTSSAFLICNRERLAVELNSVGTYA